MQLYAKFLGISLILLFCSHAFAASYGMKPYPPAGDGYKRMVIHLQPLADEDNNKVELIVGKTLNVDCNKHWFIGQLVEKIAEGWGFSYFILKSVKGPASTLMGCPPGQKKQDTFVQVRSDEGLLRYNSKLPIVVYVPNDFDVHYRIWTAREETGVAGIE